MASDELDFDEMRRRLAEAEHQVEKQGHQLERKDHQLEKEKELAERAKAEQAPTTLKHYLRLVQQQLLPTLSIEPHPSKFAPWSVTATDGKFYPLELHSWSDFEEQHEKAFSMFSKLLSDKPIFPSKTDVLGLRRNLSPGPRKNKLDIQSFVESAIEKPARRLVTAYLERSGYADRFALRNEAYSLENKDAGEAAPDCWGICRSPDDNIRRVCIGEYRAAHEVPPGAITQVLTLQPTGLFLEVLRKYQSGVSHSEKERNQEIVARILCQTYHYMVASGILYGYVTSGQTLIFLKIEESAPQKLYYYVTPVTTDSSAEVRDSPAAHLATFLVLTLDSREMQRNWITMAQKCGICLWPSLRPSGETSDSSDEEGEPGDADYNPPSERRSGTHSQPQRRESQSASGGRSQSSQEQTATRPALPFCTQACLLGLARGLPMDPSCPNTGRHRQGASGERHPTKEDVCLLTRNQLALSLDDNCECLDRVGFFGAVGVLFKITLAKYGYTFVAKGVQSVDTPHLAHEARVYARLSCLQGTNIPVYLGNITLKRPYPLASLARVTQMMLMSWAGDSLRMSSWPEDIDIEVEKERTQQALASFGIRHDDSRNANFAWNSERKQAMVLDFDQTTILRTKKRQKSHLQTAS